MEQRVVQFIRALRASGVRISLAETQDALYSTDLLGIRNREVFRAALRATLVKEARDQATFDYFFPLFFTHNQPPLENVPENLSPQDQQLLQEALHSLMGDMDALRDLLRQLLEGQAFSDQQLDQMANKAGMNASDALNQRQWYERRLNRQSGLQQVEKLIAALLEALQALGMSESAREQIAQQVRQNAQGLSEQLSRFTGQTLAEQLADREPEPQPDLMDVPFNQLGAGDVDALRDEIRRLAARLRSRAALRQKRAKNGLIDPRRMLRRNMRYGGTPLELQYHTKQVKPRLVLICDVSTSMRYCAEFLLTMVYMLQDVVAKTDSFVFIDDMVNISMIFAEKQPQEAVRQVLAENPPGYYSTNLGAALATFQRDHGGTVTSRTTVIFLGDGRNNYNDPRVEIAEELGRQARRVLWFCPEPRSQWGTGDSDMQRYAAVAQGVYRVTNLRDLTDAIDQILADG